MYKLNFSCHVHQSENDGHSDHITENIYQPEGFEENHKKLFLYFNGHTYVGMFLRRNTNLADVEAFPNIEENIIWLDIGSESRIQHPIIQLEDTGMGEDANWHDLTMANIFNRLHSIKIVVRGSDVLETIIDEFRPVNPIDRLENEPLAVHLKHWLTSTFGHLPDISRHLGDLQRMISNSQIFAGPNRITNKVYLTNAYNFFKNMIPT